MTEVVQEERFNGSVKWFNLKKGYGFLNIIETNEDVFVHFSELILKNTSSSFKTLYDGEYVSFSKKTTDDGKIVASRVTGIEGGPLFCENTGRRVILPKSKFNTETTA